MELRHLRYFVAVAEELSFRKAAEFLHVTRPAVSSQIMALEDEVGVRLLDRDTVGVRLTLGGAAFLREAKKLLEQAAAAVEIARGAAKGLDGHLTIGCVGALSSGLISPGLATFRKRLPKVDVALRELPMQEHVTALEAGDIHVGFMLGEGKPMPHYIRRRVLLRVPLQVMIGRRHRFANHPAVAMKDFVSEPVLAMAHRLQYGNGKSTLHGDQMRKVVAAYDFKLASLRTVDGFESMVGLVASGAGVTLMTNIGNTQRTKDEVAFRPFKESGPELIVELAALFLDDASSAIARQFIDALEENLTKRSVKSKPPELRSIFSR